MRSTARFFLFSALATAFFAPAPAHAQVAGFAVDQFNPSERGSDWFALDSLDLRGHVRPAIGLVGDFAHLPLAIYAPDGSVRTALVRDQLFAHVGASLVVFDRLRVGLDLPVALYQAGESGSLSGASYAAPGSFAVGDLRVAADVRLAGTYGGPFTLALGAQLFAPTGSRSDYTGDGSIRILPRLMAAGDIGSIAYAIQAGFEYRALTDSFGGAPLGSQVNVGASMGLRAMDGALLIGPEVYGSTTVASSEAIFKTRTTPLEAILGAHVHLGSDWRIGAGAGPGLTRGLGSPVLRVVASIEWAPGVKKEPLDRDHDGIVDDDDACPDVKGIKTDDPKTNGCPPDRDGDGIVDDDDACPDVKGVKTDNPKTNGCPPDRDGDGIVDDEDACPDVKGVKTDDPKTNGCPPDRDGDGIVDDDDACPDVKGIKTDNPKTNGCPPDPDRDKDGIPNDEDACPDEPGPKNADPKKNGCPMAAVKNDQIVILDQVKFATASAVILPASDPILQAVLKVLNEHPEIKRISIEGHTDSQGSAAYNKALSGRRAASVVAWLLKQGVEASRLTSSGYGLERPISTNETAEGRQNNRRVEFHIVDQGK